MYTDNYDEFLEKIDAIYIASTHETHYEYAKKALKKGKHVLCEKPLAFTRVESIELYDLAKEQGVVLMEAIKAAYCPGFQQLLNVVQSAQEHQLLFRDIWIWLLLRHQTKIKIWKMKALTF